MKTMLRLMTVAVGILLTGSAVRCQTHSVYVDEEQGKTKAVADALKAKIGGTTRYVLATETYGTESDIRLMCMEDNGYFCSYTISLWSSKTSPVQLEDTSGIVKGTAESIAETIFEVFVRESSDDKIADAVSHELTRISAFRELPEHKTTCGQTK
jgi:hypothetical protein